MTSLVCNLLGTPGRPKSSSEGGTYFLLREGTALGVSAPTTAHKNASDSSFRNQPDWKWVEGGDGDNEEEEISEQ